MAMAGGLLLALVGSACSGDDARSADASEIEELRNRFDHNRAQWRLPLDEYRPNSAAQQYLHGFAEDALLAECLDEEGLAGFPLGDPPAASITEGDPSAVGLSNEGRQLFNVDIAGQAGYHHPLEVFVADIDAYNVSPEEQAERAAFQALLAESVDNRAAFDGCLDEVRGDALPMVDFNLVQSMEQVASETAQQDDDIAEAAGRWHECMAPQGYPDLPERPDEMPSESVRADVGIVEEPEGAPSAAGSTPSTREIEVAVFDAECRESSGYSEALYQAEVEAQFHQIAGNEEELDRVRVAFDEDLERVQSIIAEHQ
ncbi:MAG: hypothetical protein ACRD29_25200 [Acidimicrobiales bacterium]